jgi:hypothetical protein
MNIKQLLRTIKFKSKVKITFDIVLIVENLKGKTINVIFFQEREMENTGVVCVYNIFLIPIFKKTAQKDLE